MAITLKELEKDVDPYLANTRLAYHLKNLQKTFFNSDVGELATKALKGQWSSPEGGVFKRLGQALQDRGLAIAKAYNFHRIDNALNVDKEVGDYVKSIVKSNNNHGGKLYRKVAEAFAPLATVDLQGNELKKHAQFDDFWDGLRSHIKNKLGSGSNMQLPSSELSDKKLYNSLRRLAYKEGDIEDAQTNKRRKSKGSDLTWRDNMSLLPDKRSVEAYKRYEEALVQYMKEVPVGCYPHVEEFIDEMKEKKVPLNELREMLEHEFHMTSEEAVKALFGYSLPKK